MSDSQSGSVEAVGPAKARSFMPPSMVLRDFLDEATVTGLLDHALAREADFAPTRTGQGEKGGVKSLIRVSMGTRDLGPFRTILKAKILSLVPDWVTKLHVTTVESPKLETELVAHNEGAFYRRHIDTQTSSDRNYLRVLSGVYYFHAEPKAFTGGALRLYAIGAENAPFVDIEPKRNTLLVFPSWAPHEVMAIGCPSGRFIDSRFAINCWVHRGKAAVVA
jgi:predicted 2-oxoglutarate/Fe(II)-dependent dioxygenase YbiX